MGYPVIVVCAAMKNRQSGVIVSGPRHGDCIRLMVLAEIDKNPSIDNWDMGFVDQDNNFLTREAAWTIADKNGQIRRPCGLEESYDNARKTVVGDDGHLFSENLY